ncbi:MAG: hypothetical protein M3367_02985 [Acidobacteriota bacterium]|nr:hypothetical protein [Acidobacteriota bacterium]
MNLAFSIDFNPEIATFERELKTDVESLSREIIKDVAQLAPLKMRESFGGNPPSPRGGPPAIDTGYLSNSLQGTVINATTGHIEMAHYAQYLDPFLGGHLDRPFIERAIAKTLDELR